MSISLYGNLLCPEVCSIDTSNWRCVPSDTCRCHSTYVMWLHSVTSFSQIIIIVDASMLHSSRLQTNELIGITGKNLYCDVSFW